MRFIFCFSVLLALAYGSPVSRRESAENVERREENDKPWLERVPHILYDDLENELLNGLEDDDKEEYFRIKSDHNLSLKQKKEKYLQWAEEVNRKGEMESFLEEQAKWTKMERDQLAEIAENLGEKMRDVLEIVEHEKMTRRKQKEQIHEIIKDSSRPIARVLRILFPEFISSRQKRDWYYHGKATFTLPNQNSRPVLTDYQFNMGGNGIRHG